MSTAVQFGIVFGLFVFVGLTLQGRLPDKYKWAGPIIGGVIAVGLLLLLKLAGVVDR